MHGHYHPRQVRAPASLLVPRQWCVRSNATSGSRQPGVAHFRGEKHESATRPLTAEPGSNRGSRRRRPVAAGLGAAARVGFARPLDTARPLLGVAGMVCLHDGDEAANPANGMRAIHFELSLDGVPWVDARGAPSIPPWAHFPGRPPPSQIEPCRRVDFANPRSTSW